jgi:CRP-like cAMP-binding protein
MGYRPMICQEAHPLSAAALEDCSYLFIPREAFLKMLKQSPSLSNLLLETLGHEFSVWVSSMSFFASQRVKERIVLALLKLHEIYRPEDGGKVIIRLNRTDFAGYVGTAKETLVRVLGELKKKNMIASEGSKIRITDREALIGMLR